MSAPAQSQALRQDAEVIGLVGLAHATSHFFHLVMPPLFPWLMKEFDLNFTQAGFLVSVFFVVSGVGQALAGFVVDRTGARPVLFFGVGTLAASGVLLGTADGYTGLVLAAAVAGLGNSIFHPADFTLLNRRVTAARLGHAFSVHGLSGNLGWAAAPLFVAGIASVAGWRAAGLSAAALGAAALMILVLRREALDEGATRHVVVARDDARPDAGSSGLAFLGSGAVWMCFLFFLFATGAFGVLQSYAPAVLGQVYGLPLALATAALTAYLLGAAAGTVAGGFVAGKVEHNDRVIALALGASAAIAVLLALDVVPSWSVIGFMACMGFGVGIATPSRDMLVRKAATSRFGKQSFGRIYGFVYSGLDIGLAATPLVIGPFLDRGEFAAALFAVALLQSAALLSAARVGRGLRAGRHS